MIKEQRHHNRHIHFYSNTDKLIKALLMCALYSISHIGIAQDIVNIQINPTVLPTGDCKLSDITESIEYVPLETNDKCLIGRVHAFDISKNYIVVYCSQSESIYLFNRKGRFICQVGRYGAGPGEYLSINGLFIDEKRSRIIIMTGYQRKQLNYNFKGKFIGDVSMEEYGFYRRLYNDHFFILTNNHNGNVPFVYEIRDLDLKLITSKIETVYFETGSGMNVVGKSHQYMYNEKIYTRSIPLNDTVYVIEKDFSFIPKYVLNAGKYKVTSDLLSMHDGSAFLKRAQEYVSFRDFYQTKDKVFIIYQFGNTKSYYCYYDTNTHQIRYFKSEKGIPNDLDGGIDFWPQRQDNRLWYAFYDAYLFEKELSSKQKDTPKGAPKEIQAFNKLMKTLDPEDNPVLTIVTIKE